MFKSILRIGVILSFVLIGRGLYQQLTNVQVDDTEVIKFAPTESRADAFYKPAIRLHMKGGMCSAVVINNVYALTAAHCAHGFTRFMSKDPIQVTDMYDLPTGIKAKFVAIDFDRDVALVKADFKDFQNLRVNFGYSPKKDELMAACGFPGNGTFICTLQSYVGNYGFQYQVRGGTMYRGMSGGPVINAFGEVIGVNSAVAETGNIIAPVAGLDGTWGL